MRSPAAARIFATMSSSSLAISSSSSSLTYSARSTVLSSREFSSLSLSDRERLVDVPAGPSWVFNGVGGGALAIAPSSRRTQELSPGIGTQ